jgi:transposase-like protein
VEGGVPMLKKKGRKEIYDPKRYPGIAAALMRRGATKAELATAFNVGERTIYDWSKKYPDFSQAIKENAKTANAVIVNSLYLAAQEHTVQEIREIFMKKEDVKEPVRVKAEAYTRVIPANVTAIAMWLNNRDPENWRRNPEAANQDDPNKDPLIQMLDEIRDEPDDENYSDTHPKTVQETA